MSKFQVIYTSCKRGINSLNDGQQIYSYTQGILETYQMDSIRGLFGYIAPTLDLGLTLNEETIKTFPSSFSYKWLDENWCAFAQNTYLGKDYMGDKGRYGNYMSHVVLSNHEHINSYPCEYYFSPMLRNGMSFQEVNLADKPNYLDDPTIEEGVLISFDKICDFLLTEHRLVIFKNMFHALLLSGETKKRILICDSLKNVILWIASLEYAFPIDLARKISFTTYDYNPLFSSFQICGVVPKGSKYNIHEQDLFDSAYVFDFLHNKTVEFDIIDQEFYAFFELAVTISKENLSFFINFVSNASSLSDINLNYYNAFLGYMLYSTGLKEFNVEKLDKALYFLQTYISQEHLHHVVTKVLTDDACFIHYPNDKFMVLFTFLANSIIKLSSIENERIHYVIKEKILFEYFSETTTQESYTKLWEEADDIVKNKTSMSLNHLFVTTIIDSKHRASIIESLSDAKTATWKKLLLVHFLFVYMNDLKGFEELQINHAPFEAFIRETLHIIIHNEEGLFFDILPMIEKHFISNIYNLCWITFILDQVLSHNNNDQMLHIRLWNASLGLLATQYYDQRKLVFTLLKERDLSVQMVSFFNFLLKASKDIESAKMIFDDYFNAYILTDSIRSSEHMFSILSQYYEHIKGSNDKKVKMIEKALVFLLINHKINAPFYFELTNKILDKIAFEDISEFDTKLILMIAKFNQDIAHIPNSEKLQLLIFCIELMGLNNYSSIDVLVANIKKSISDNYLKIHYTSDQDIAAYVVHVMPSVMDFCHSPEDFQKFLLLHSLGVHKKEIFLDTLAATIIKMLTSNPKWDELYYAIASIIAFDKNYDWRQLANVLSNMNEKKVLVLSNNIKDKLSNDKAFIKKWEIVESNIHHKSSFFNKMTHMLQKKKQ